MCWESACIVVPYSRPEAGLLSPVNETAVALLHQVNVGCIPAKVPVRRWLRLPFHPQLSTKPPTASETEEPTRETTPDEPADDSTTEPTTEPTANPDPAGGNSANKGGRAGEEEGGDSTVLVAIIAASASVICVAIVSFCAWLIFTQRRKR